jgi:hypothetical protein
MEVKLYLHSVFYRKIFVTKLANDFTEQVHTARNRGVCLVGPSEGTGVEIKGLITDAEREDDESGMLRIFGNLRKQNFRNMKKVTF